MNQNEGGFRFMSLLQPYKRALYGVRLDKQKTLCLITLRQLVPKAPSCSTRVTSELTLVQTRLFKLCDCFTGMGYDRVRNRELREKVTKSGLPLCVEVFISDQE